MKYKELLVVEHLENHKRYLAVAPSSKASVSDLVKISHGLCIVVSRVWVGSNEEILHALGEYDDIYGVTEIFSAYWKEEPECEEA